MNDSPADGTVVGAPAQHGTAKRHFAFALVAVAAFGLYWLSSFVLEARHATTHFGADAHLYAPLAKGTVVDRVARFHPLTVAMAAAWMNALSPLTAWLTQLQLLKAMFAAAGAIGVWAAMAAFAAVMPRGYATLCGVIYATSFAVWYFSSIEESKIVTASLSVLYIAVYLRLRGRWSGRRAVLLTAILLLGCLNEIVASFLMVIPLVDTLRRQGWDWRQYRWIAAHGLAVPAAFVVLETVVNGTLVAAAADTEGGSHLSMLVFYILKSDHSPASLYSFLANWLFFSIAAPTPNAPYWANILPNTAGYFEPVLANYFFSPVSAGLIAVLGAMIVVSVLPRYRADGPTDPSGIVLPLAAYALVRGVFFFIFNPPEPLLFSPAVMLAHFLMLGVAYAASTFPAKRMLLGVFAALLFVTNGSFIAGRTGGGYSPPFGEPSPLIQYPPK